MATSADLHKRVAQVLAAEVVPALNMDGAQLEVLDVVDSVARIQLASHCGNCPDAIMLVIAGIEQELRRHVPEIKCIEIVP
jgi:Fe-S cluster biogenesis protein NfuA